MFNVFSHSIRVYIYDIINRTFAKKKINKSKLVNVPGVQKTEGPLSQDLALPKICFIVSMTTHVALDSRETVARMSYDKLTTATRLRYHKISYDKKGTCRIFVSRQHVGATMLKFRTTVVR